MLLNTGIFDQSGACNFTFYETAVVTVEAPLVAAKRLRVAALLAIGTGHLETVHVGVEEVFVVIIYFTQFHASPCA
jgi:hypothetical protein